MMTDSEKLDLILSNMQEMKDEIQVMKKDIRDMKKDIRELQQRVTKIELHLENATDKNIQLLAENFIELTDKLNRAVPAADNNRAYEVKVNYLIERVSSLEKEMAELKVRTGVILEMN